MRWGPCLAGGCGGKHKAVEGEQKRQALSARAGTRQVEEGPERERRGCSQSNVTQDGREEGTRARGWGWKLSGQGTATPTRPDVEGNSRGMTMGQLISLPKSLDRVDI